MIRFAEAEAILRRGAKFAGGSDIPEEIDLDAKLYKRGGSKHHHHHHQNDDQAEGGKK